MSDKIPEIGDIFFYDEVSNIPKNNIFFVIDITHVQGDYLSVKLFNITANEFAPEEWVRCKTYFAKGYRLISRAYYLTNPESLLR